MAGYIAPMVNAMNKRRFNIWMVMATAIFSCCLSHAAILAGTTRDQAIAELGAPTGTIVMGTREVLYYDRGTVELRDGKVVRANLVTPEEARQRREAEARAYQQWLRAEAERIARRKAEGEQELKRMLNDPAFLIEDAESQLEIWQDFMRKYPEVPVGSYVLDAQRQADEARERRETAERLSNLEQRTAEAEARARAAEDEADRLRSQTSTSYSLVWPVPYYYYPSRPSYAQPCPPRKPIPVVRAGDATGGLLPGANEFQRPTVPKPDKHSPDSRRDGVY